MTWHQHDFGAGRLCTVIADESGQRMYLPDGRSRWPGEVTPLEEIVTGPRGYSSKS